MAYCKSENIIVKHLRMLQTKKNINYYLKHNYLVQNVKRTKVRKTFNPKLCTVVYLIIWNAHFLDHKLLEDTELKVFHFFPSVRASQGQRQHLAGTGDIGLNSCGLGTLRHEDCKFEGLPLPSIFKYCWTEVYLKYFNTLHKFLEKSQCLHLFNTQSFLKNLCVKTVSIFQKQL